VCQNVKSLECKKIFEMVEKCIGVPFKEHGRDLQGFDCYGIALYILNPLGYNLPDFNYDENWAKCGNNYFIENYYKYAKQINRNELQPVDVILFKNDPEVVNHIGIYLGGGKFIHCDRKSGVIISRLNQQPYCRRIDSFYRLKKTK